MPLLDMLKEKYQGDSRDYTLDLMAHRHFELVLAEAYECKILSNPWLAASTAASHADDPPTSDEKQDQAVSIREEVSSSMMEPCSKDDDKTSESSTAANKMNDEPETAETVPVERALAASEISAEKVTAELVDHGDDVYTSEPEAVSSGASKTEELEKSPSNTSNDNVGVASSSACMVESQSTEPTKSILEVSSEAPPLPPAATSTNDAQSKEGEVSIDLKVSVSPTASAISNSSKDEGGETPAISTSSNSDATFGTTLREKFVEGARVIRRHHGITCIKEPGEDPQLDYLVNEVMLTYQRLKVRLLKASNQEAQFRLDLETKVAQGIWNQYDLAESPRGRVENDFVVYQPGSPTQRKSPSDRSQPGGSRAVSTHQGQGGRGFGGGRYTTDNIRRRMDQEQAMESYRVETSASGMEDGDDGEYRPHTACGGNGGGDGRGGAFGGMSAIDRKRSASGKFEKNQVLPLTEWLLKHSTNPYPSMDDKATLSAKSGLSTQQVQNWFINMRKRHWTPMMNGKRRPRTFLDYVILSSQQSDKDGSSGGASPGGRGIRGKGTNYGPGSEDSPMSDGFDEFGPKSSLLMNPRDQGRLQQQLRQLQAAQQQQQHQHHHQKQQQQHEEQQHGTRSSSRLSMKPSLDFHDDDGDAFNDDGW